MSHKTLKRKKMFYSIKEKAVDVNVKAESFL